MENENNQKASSIAKREKKRVRREAKAARKAANQVEEKKSRPNNIVLAVLIFGVLIGMFAFVKGYNYFSKPASLEAYIEENGGEETYGSMSIDQFTTAAITAEKNSMKIVLDTTVEEELVKDYTDYYSGDSGADQLKYLAAYFLTSMKPEVRGGKADVKITANVNGKEVASAEMTYKEAKEYLEPDEEETEDAEAEDDTADEDAEAESGAEADTAEAESEAEADTAEGESGAESSSGN